MLRSPAIRLHKATLLSLTQPSARRSRTNQPVSMCRRALLGFTHVLPRLAIPNYAAANRPCLTQCEYSGTAAVKSRYPLAQSRDPRKHLRSVTIPSYPGVDVDMRRPTHRAQPSEFSKTDDANLVVPHTAYFIGTAVVTVTRRRKGATACSRVSHSAD